MENKIRYKMIGKSLWFPDEKILAIADLHIGYEDSLSSSGVFIPKGLFLEIIEELKKIFESIGKNNIKEIVICGDLKHEFGRISNQEWRETLKILEFLESYGKVVLVKGNHDNMLEPIARKKGMRLTESYVSNGILFVHGHFLSEKETKLIKSREIEVIVAGHKHPAVVISDKYKSERYKCFLAGKWKGKEAIVLPSFFPLVEGRDVSGIDEGKFFISDSELADFEAYVPANNEVLRFGKVKKFL